MIIFLKSDKPRTGNRCGVFYYLTAVRNVAAGLVLLAGLVSFSVPANAQNAVQAATVAAEDAAPSVTAAEGQENWYDPFEADAAAARADIGTEDAGGKRRSSVDWTTINSESAADAIRTPYSQAKVINEGTLDVVEPAAPPPTRISAVMPGQTSSDWIDPFYDRPASRVLTDRSLAEALGIGASSRLRKAISFYRVIIDNGGWPQIPAGDTLEYGSQEPRVLLLRQRLIATNDMDNTDAHLPNFDQELEDAVRRFQLRIGLEADGLVGRNTRNAMNVPAKTRLKTLELNLARVEELEREFRGVDRYVLVNIAGAELEAVSDDKVERRHKVVVGRVDRQTPMVISEITHLNFNPYWHVPDSIAWKDLIPKFQSDPDYAENNQMRIYNGWGGEEIDPGTIDWTAPEALSYKIRQEPGTQNSLGTMRIQFANRYSVYLHDTPGQSLFDRVVRAFSSGCVRVEGVHDLGNWLVNGQEDWDRARIDEVVALGERFDLYLHDPVPLFMAYLTGWVRKDGVVQFRDDIYGHDQPGWAANYTDFH